MRRTQKEHEAAVSGSSEATRWKRIVIVLATTGSLALLAGILAIDKGFYDVGAWTDGELFWIIKHGIKDTGMVALPPGHADEDVWAVAAFVRQLPDVPPTRYQAMAASYQADAHPSGHR